MKTALIIVVVLGIAGYAYFEARKLLTGPVITITYPANGATVAEELLTLKGNARNVAFLSLNGRQIFTDEKGNFEEKLLLADGYTILTIEARDRVGREKTVMWELVHKSKL